MDISKITSILGDDYEDLAKSIMKKDFDISKVSPQLKDLLASGDSLDKISLLTSFLDKSDDKDSNGILKNVLSIGDKVGFGVDDAVGSIVKNIFK